MLASLARKNLMYVVVNKFEKKCSELDGNSGVVFKVGHLVKNKIFRGVFAAFNIT